MNTVGTTVKPTAIMVLGMHRSGTSATTRVLNLLGVELGSSLLGPQPDNKKGFWEHFDAVQIHERLLEALGRDWHDLRELPPGWLEHPASLRAIDEIVGLIHRDFSGVQLWAVKDPRMCRFAPLWIQALNQLGIRAAALIVVRDPREVAASLNVRDGLSYAHCWLMWAQHVLESVNATEHIPRAMLKYDELMKDWESNAARIGAELDISWPRSTGNARSDIDTFLSRADRHHRVREATSVEQGEHIPPQWLMQLMDLCSALVAGRTGWSPIATFHSDYLAHAALFAGPIAELTHDRKTLLKVALERMDVIEQVQRNIAEHSAHLKSAMGAIDTKSGEFAELMRQHQDVQRRHESLQRERENLQREHANLEREHANFQQEHANLQQEHANMEQEHANLQRLHEDLSAQHSLLEKVCEAQRMEQAALESAMSELELAKLQLEKKLEGVRTVTRSRRWLLRRIAQITFRGSVVNDVDLG